MSNGILYEASILSSLMHLCLRSREQIHREPYYSPLISIVRIINIFNLPNLFILLGVTFSQKPKIMFSCYGCCFHSVQAILIMDAQRTRNFRTVVLIEMLLDLCIRVITAGHDDLFQSEFLSGILK